MTDINCSGRMHCMETVTEQLRRAVEACGQSRYAICAATGIDKAAMSRFMVNGTGLHSASIDKLCLHLGLVLKPGKPEKKGR